MLSRSADPATCRPRTGTGRTRGTDGRRTGPGCAGGAEATTCADSSTTRPTTGPAPRDDVHHDARAGPERALIRTRDDLHDRPVSLDLDTDGLADSAHVPSIDPGCDDVRKGPQTRPFRASNRDDR